MENSILGAKSRSHCFYSTSVKFYFGKLCFSCISGSFQTKGRSASLSEATDFVGLNGAGVIFCQHWWSCSLLLGNHNVVSPVLQWNTKATYSTAFQMILLLLHLLSHDTICLHSHVALGFLGQCQEVRIFPGESGARERERGLVTPAGWADQEVTVVLTAGLQRPAILSNYGSEVSCQCLCCLIKIVLKSSW